MKGIFKFIVSALLCMICIEQLCAQNLSNRGRDFWVGYGHHQFMEYGSGGQAPNNGQEMILYFSTEQTANVTVRIEGTTWVRNYVVPAFSVITSDLIPKGAIDARLISLPCSFVPAGTPCGGEGIFTNKGIHITSNVPIVAYAHIYGSTSSGASMLMPVETWGYEYVTLNSRQNFSEGSGRCFSWAYVIAQRDNTVIEVTPTQTTRGGRAPNTAFTINLNRGQIYQFMAGPENGVSKPELSGTKVRSIANAAGECFPIAVFSGSSRTSNPLACGSGGGDNDNQQCFPSQAWGKRYLTAPTSTAANAAVSMTNAYKIAVKDPTTNVFRNGTQIPLASLQNGTYYFESNQAQYITSNKPIMVAQYMTGGTACAGSSTSDPEMMYISPIEQGIKRIGFYRNTRESITVNYLTLIIPTAGISSLLIDGTNTFSHNYLHPQLPGYSVVVRRWTAAQSQAIVQSDSAFTAITYGLGGFESYGYNAGTLINNLSAVGSIYNTSDTSTTTVSHPFTCTNTPVKLSVLLGYETPPSRLVWQLSQVGGGLSPNIDVVQNNPTPVGTQVINGISYFKFDLPTDYTFTTAGTFTVTLLATHPSIENCNNTEEVSYQIEVRGKPATDFAVTSTGCYLDTVYLTGQIVSANGFNINQWLYTFPDASTSVSKDTSKLFAGPGTFNVNLRIVSSEGCVGDTTKTISLTAAPIVGFSSAAPSPCLGSVFTFTDTSSYTGTGSLNNSWWDFGDGTIVTATNVAPITHTYTSYGTFTVRHSAGAGTSCVGDTVSQTITVFAPPTTSFSYPAGCLPASGTVNFTSTASTPDGQAIASHLWNFGDPASGVNNNSTLPNPTHTYPGFGNYTITYTVTTVNGCTRDTTVNATLNLAPTFNYPALAPVCQNSTTPISVATATVTNGVPGAGVYNGPGTNAAGNFNPATAGAGVHTIWYVYTTTANCIDSVSQTITVNPTPDASFAITTAACLPASGIVPFTYSGTALPGQTYAWNFGDPASGVNNTSALPNPTHNYTTGTYTISLTVSSAAGCIKDSVVTNTFNVTPALNYPALAPVCESVTGTISVATATVTNGATGTGVYSGPGVNAAGNFSPSIAGAGTHTIWYVFTATGNCIDSVSQTILVHPKPTASFTYPTTACLPTTGIAQFTYNGTVQPGQTYLWNFGDPASGANNTSGLANPSHIYTNTGSYSVSVTVTNANGCVDDSVITTTFSVTPALNYPALAAVCESVVGTISVATATVSNGVLGTGVYSGPGTDAAGNFNPSVAGPGTHTITYTFTSTGNCVASTSQTIVVNPKPIAAFSMNPSICLGETASIVNSSSIPSGSISTWNWNYGDGNTASYTNGNTYNYTFSSAGTYQVQLVTIGANGCVSDTVRQTIVVNSIPVASFNMPASVCMPNGTVTFTNNSTVAGGPGLTYVWNFGDGNSSTQTSPSHVYAAINAYTVTLRATSSAGCFDDSVRVFSAFFDKPIANFAVTPDSLCEGVNNNFTDLSTAPNSSISSRLWMFGDGTTSTVANPTKRYNNPGSYTVKLAVTNNESCVSDTFSRVVRVYLQPVLDAGPSFVVPQGTVIRFNPTANDSTVTNFLWSPGFGLSNATMLRPTLTATTDQTYTLTATAEGNCTASDFLTVKILRPLIVPNAFSPNGDNVNDRWQIDNLTDYTGVVVEVFNRYGQLVYTSTGYGTAWDGNSKGKPLPVGTYYYIIQLKNGFKPMNGSVTIIR